MSSSVSSRIMSAIDALPLKHGLRVLEIGCGSGVAAREIVRRWPDIYVLGIDRSSAAIRQALAGSQPQIAAGQVAFCLIAVEEFKLLPNEPLFDLAFALRVGALDGRYPQARALALPDLRAALVPGGRIFINSGNAIRELSFTTT